MSGVRLSNVASRRDLTTIYKTILYTISRYKEQFGEPTHIWADKLLEPFENVLKDLTGLEIVYEDRADGATSFDIGVPHMSINYWEGAVAKSDDPDDMDEAINVASEKYLDKHGTMPTVISVHSSMAELIADLADLAISRDGPSCPYPTYVYVGIPESTSPKEKSEPTAEPDGEPPFGETVETPESSNVASFVFESYEDGSSEGVLWVTFKSGDTYMYTELPDEYAVRLYAGKESRGKLMHEIADKYTGEKR